MNAHQERHLALCQKIRDSIRSMTEDELVEKLTLYGMEFERAEDEPSLPPMPVSICKAQDKFRDRDRVTQTHVVVTWVVADQHGMILHKHKKGTFICRSDGGETEQHPINYQTV